MPEKGSNVQFTGNHKQLKSPFVIYPEFEYNLKEAQKTNRNNPNESYSNKHQDHIACSYEYKLVDFDNIFGKPVQKQGKNKNKIKIQLLIFSVNCLKEYCKKAIIFHKLRLLNLVYLLIL